MQQKTTRYQDITGITHGQALMEKYVATINAPPDIPNKQEPLVRPEGDYWAVVDQVTGNLTLQPGKDNAFILPKTVKAQEY